MELEYEWSSYPLLESGSDSGSMELRGSEPKGSSARGVARCAGITEFSYAYRLRSSIERLSQPARSTVSLRSPTAIFLNLFRYGRNEFLLQWMVRDSIHADWFDVSIVISLTGGPSRSHTPQWQCSESTVPPIVLYGNRSINKAFGSETEGRNKETGPSPFNKHARGINRK